jgi:diguanylate cyclase (GGDEF)-like protein/PAS domain S-box-containing protein
MLVRAGAPSVSADVAGNDAQEYEALLQFLYLAPVGLVQLAMDGDILMMNPLSAQLLMPLSQDGNLTNLFDALASVAPDLRHLCADFPAAYGQVCDASRLHLHAGIGGDGGNDGNGPQVLSLSMLKLDGGRLMAVLSDVTLQERRERQLRKTDAWLSAIMTNITDYALVSLDKDGMVESWNESIGRVTGFDAASVVGKSYELFYPAGASTPEQRQDRLRDADDNGWSLEEGLRSRADGGQFWGSSMISPLPDRSGAAVQPTAQPAVQPTRCAQAEVDDESAYCLIIRDISDKRDIGESLHKATYCDHSTGLSNRRAFFEAGALELARRQRSPRPVSLIMLDADHFKALNDEHGHPAGDAVLRQLAASIKSVCRQVDVPARIGSEKFAAILPSVDLAVAMALAERLRAHVELAPTLHEGRAITCTVSIGVATMDDTLAGVDDLIKRADQALHAAKRRGRNQVASWTSDMPECTKQDLSVPS